MASMILGIIISANEVSSIRVLKNTCFNHISINLKRKLMKTHLLFFYEWWTFCLGFSVSICNPGHILSNNYTRPFCATAPFENPTISGMTVAMKIPCAQIYILNYDIRIFYRLCNWVFTMFCAVDYTYLLYVHCTPFHRRGLNSSCLNGVLFNSKYPVPVADGHRNSD